MSATPPVTAKMTDNVPKTFEGDFRGGALISLFAGHSYSVTPGNIPPVKSG
jgi:hypothetical protein